MPDVSPCPSLQPQWLVVQNTSDTASMQPPPPCSCFAPGFPAPAPGGAPHLPPARLDFGSLACPVLPCLDRPGIAPREGCLSRPCREHRAQTRGMMCTSSVDWRTCMAMHLHAHRCHRTPGHPQNGATAGATQRLCGPAHGDMGTVQAGSSRPLSSQPPHSGPRLSGALRGCPCLREPGTGTASLMP